LSPFFPTSLLPRLRLPILVLPFPLFLLLLPAMVMLLLMIAVRDDFCAKVVNSLAWGILESKCEFVKPYRLLFRTISNENPLGIPTLTKQWVKPCGRQSEAARPSALRSKAHSRVHASGAQSPSPFHQDGKTGAPPHALCASVFLFVLCRVSHYLSDDMHHL